MTVRATARPTRSAGWVPVALIALILIPAVAGPHRLAEVSGLILNHHGDGTTSLSGVVADQAALHGLLRGVRDLGLTLISVEVIVPTDTSRDRRT